MGQAANQYKVALDQYTTNADKNIVVDMGEAFQFMDQRDLISLRAESYMDEFFKEENPTIDFEKYKFKPDISFSGMSFYFYQRDIATQNPITYNDSVPSVWYFTDPLYELSSGFNETDVPDSILFLDSYFKFEFSLDPLSQKPLFSIALPLDGTMLNPNNPPAPKIDFHQTIKTELEYIYWLRRPDQLPGVNFTGGTLDIFCLITFFNSKTRKTTSFKYKPDLPNSASFLATNTILDRYLLYRLDYTNFTYNIFDVNGGNIINNNRINMYNI